MVEKEDDLLLMVYVENTKGKRDDAWYLDFGCSNHMCGDRTLFTKFEGFQHTVKLGNHFRMNVTTRSNVQFVLNGVKHTITDVYYVPEMKTNLLSMGQL